MNKVQFLEKLITLEKFVRQGRTGTPDEFARRLSISRSALYEIISELKSYGVDIKYCRTRCSFYYNSNLFLDIHFSLKELTPDELINISGGHYFFSFRPLFRMEGLYLCIVN